MRKVFTRRLAMLMALLLLVLVATGCVGTRLGVSWAALRTLGDDQHIVVSFNSEIVKIDPRSGTLVELKDDEGNTRFDPETGQPRLWRIDGTQLQNAQFFSAPVEFSEDNNTLLIASAALRMMQINDATARIDDPNGLPLADVVVADIAMDDERIYVPLNERGVQAFDRESMEQVWLVATDGGGVWSQPIINNGTLYFTSMDHHVYAVDSASGEILWQTDLLGAAAGGATLYEDHLYVGSFGRKVYKLNLEGEIVSEFATDNWVWHTPTIVDGVVYIADLSGIVYALDAEDMTLIWRMNGVGGGIRAAPLVTDEHVIVASRTGLVEWFNRQSGAKAFERNIESEVLSDLLLVEPSDTLNIPEPLVIISTVNPGRLLVAYTAVQGGRAWVYPPE